MANSGDSDARCSVNSSGSLIWEIPIHKTRYTASNHNPLHSRLKALERHNLTPQSDEDNINKLHTVKPVLSGHSKIDKTKILMKMVA